MSDQAKGIEGTIDSIRDGVAVILADVDETGYTVPADEIPEEAREGSRVEVHLEGEAVTAVVVIEAVPSSEEIRGRMERLASQRPSRLLRRPEAP